MKRRCGGTASAQLVGQIGIGRRMAGREIDSRTVMARFKLTHGDLAHRQSSGIAVRTIAQCKTQSSARCFFWVGDERPVRLDTRARCGRKGKGLWSATARWNPSAVGWERWMGARLLCTEISAFGQTVRTDPRPTRNPDSRLSVRVCGHGMWLLARNFRRTNRRP